MSPATEKLVTAVHTAAPLAIAGPLVNLAFRRGGARFWPSVAVLLATVLFMSTSFGSDLSGLISTFTGGWLS